MSKSETITFKRGTLVYPRLDRPDTKFNELGVYVADLKLTEEAAKPFMEKLKAVWKDHMGKAHPAKPDKSAKGCLWFYEVDDEGNETGNVIFKCKVKNTKRKDGKLWDRKPLLVDSKRQPVPEGTNPWGGTVATVKAEIFLQNNSYGKGVSLQPIVVQLIDLITGGSGPDLSDLDEEDGYEAPTGTSDDFYGDADNPHGAHGFADEDDY